MSVVQASSDTVTTQTLVVEVLLFGVVHVVDRRLDARSITRLPEQRGELEELARPEAGRSSGKAIPAFLQHAFSTSTASFIVSRASV